MIATWEEPKLNISGGGEELRETSGGPISSTSDSGKKGNKAEQRPKAGFVASLTSSRAAAFDGNTLLLSAHLQEELPPGGLDGGNAPPRSLRNQYHTPCRYLEIEYLVSKMRK